LQQTLSNLRQRDELLQGSPLASIDGGKNKGIATNDSDLSLLDRDNRNADSATREAFVNNGPLDAWELAVFISRRALAHGFQCG